MIDLLIVIDYYQLLSEKAFSVRYYWVIQSWDYEVLSWIDKMLTEKTTDRNKLLFVSIF